VEYNHLLFVHLQTQQEWEQKVDYAKMNPSTRESELQEIESQLERVVWALEEKKELIAELLGDEEEEDTPRGDDGEEGAAVRAPGTRLIASPASHVVWHAAHHAHLPCACPTFQDIEGGNGAAIEVDSTVGLDKIAAAEREAKSAGRKVQKLSDQLKAATEAAEEATTKHAEQQATLEKELAQLRDENTALKS
jgi:hypothetical protein